MASRTEQRLLTADEFLRIDFGSGLRAELDRGVIRMMAGGSREHARVQMNLYRFLGTALRGSGCRPYGSDMAVRTAPDSVRYPDVTIDCAPTSDDDEQVRVLPDPRVVIEVLSPSTRGEDEGIKLAEYRDLPTLTSIVLVDPARRGIRHIRRDRDGEWVERLVNRVDGLALPEIGVTMPHDEVFATD